MQLENERIKAAIKETIGPAFVSLLEEDDVIEIIRNANGLLCVERLGRGIEESSLALCNRAAESLIRFLASSIGEVCNKSHPSLSLKLPFWHARFQGLLPPVVDAPSFSIRKHNKRVFTLTDYLSKGELTYEQFSELTRAIHERENIVISGGTGSGKTTFANALLLEMEKTGDRIITVEDTPELRLNAKIGQQIFTKEAIGYDSRQALKDILRMRPDRIVLGELRDGACLDLIKAWNTGHAGGLTTLHANSAELAMQRIESLIKEVSVTVPRDLIAQTVNVVVQVQRKDARRLVTEIKRISGRERNAYFFTSFGGNHAKNHIANNAHDHHVQPALCQ